MKNKKRTCHKQKIHPGHTREAFEAMRMRSTDSEDNDNHDEIEKLMDSRNENENLDARRRYIIMIV